MGYCSSRNARQFIENPPAKVFQTCPQQRLKGPLNPSKITAHTAPAVWRQGAPCLRDATQR